MNENIGRRIRGNKRAEELEGAKTSCCVVKCGDEGEVDSAQRFVFGELAGAVYCFN